MDRSVQEQVIATQTISEYLIKNNVKYELLADSKNRFYVYKLITINNDDNTTDDVLRSVKNLRYQMTEKFAGQEISIMIGCFIFFLVLAILSFFLNSIIAFVFCFTASQAFLFRFSFTKKKLNEIKN